MFAGVNSAHEGLQGNEIARLDLIDDILEMGVGKIAVFAAIGAIRPFYVTVAFDLCSAVGTDKDVSLRLHHGPYLLIDSICAAVRAVRRAHRASEGSSS